MGALSAVGVGALITPWAHVRLEPVESIPFGAITGFCVAGLAIRLLSRGRIRVATAAWAYMMACVTLFCAPFVIGCLARLEIDRLVTDLPWMALAASAGGVAASPFFFPVVYLFVVAVDHWAMRPVSGDELDHAMTEDTTPL